MRGVDGQGRQVTFSFVVRSDMGNEWGDDRALLDSRLVIFTGQDPRLPVTYAVARQPLPGRGKRHDLCVALPDSRGYSGFLLSSLHHDTDTLVMNLEFGVLDTALKTPNFTPIRTLPRLKKAVSALGEEMGTCTLRRVR